MEQLLTDYTRYLMREERAAATVKQYRREAERFLRWAGGAEPDREMVLRYKAELVGRCRPTSANTKIVALNGFLTFLGRADLRVKGLKIQRAAFCSGERELTREDYRRLIAAARARKDERTALLIETIGSTGIRVSELRFITAEAVRSGAAHVNCKGKNRTVLLPQKLCRRLAQFLQRRGVTSGPVFVTRTGRPLDRSNIWKMLKALCREANVGEKKVFPHNLRHLFARCFYNAQHDLVKLADLLGHASVDTTRIYTISSGAEHRRALDALGLVI